MQQQTEDMQQLASLRGRVGEAMGRDRHRLRRRLRQAEQAAKAGKPFDKNLRKLRRDLEASAEERAKRAASVPRTSYDDELPIAAWREEIGEAIRQNQVVIVCGDTGSGKSTQLPKVCLDAGRGVDGMIGHTQPRRLAARSLASRVSQELGAAGGTGVGFKVRFTDTTRPEAYIKLMTDGVLLAETQSDRFLNQYDTIIIDEAHERSLNIDFLLGYLKGLLTRRRDLKLIITSATIDPQRFADHFADENGPAPVIEIPGRTYPVDVQYRPMESDEPEVEDREMTEAIVEAVDELSLHDDGDVLVFLPTERDIRETAKALRKRGQFGGTQRATEVLPLYARLSAAEQNRIFAPHGGRRIVLATNVAETSLTVPGIRHVVDTGLARISRFSARAEVQRLPIEPIAQASAEQRKGRCGRTGPGICVRLYSEGDFAERETFTPPEVLRTNLASVILQMKALGLGRIEEFAFLDPPKSGMVRAGYRTLHELGAIDEKEELTEVGQHLAKLPVDPRIGRMVLAGEQENRLADVLIIAAALEVQDPRVRPPEQQQKADEKHGQFADEQSDFLSYLKLWDFYHELKAKLSQNQLRRACQENFLSPNRMREWVDIHRQLKDLARESGLKVGERKDDYESLHRALLTGLLSHVAVLGKGHDYTGAGGKELYLWPGSGLFAKKPKWVMAAELVETTKLYARTVARIQPEWIEPIASHLVNRSYSEPHWDAESGRVMAFEKVSLFGLTIVPRRRAHYGPVDPAKARELFIHHALVEGECELTAPFFKHNQRLVERVRELEAKTRRPDLLVEQQVRYAFYDGRVPKGIHNVPAFETWRKEAERENPKLLYMSEADLVQEGSGEAVTDQAYPNELALRDLELPLEYRLNPGERDDGVTLTAPLEVLNQLSEQQLDWAVPGYLYEKVLALIRSLPKSIRRNFVPAPDYAKQVMEHMRYGQGALEEAVAEALGRLTGVSVPTSAFKPETLPEHLKVNVRVVDDEGKAVGEGRDLAALRKDLGAEASASFADLGDSSVTRSGMTSWDIDELPKRVDVAHGGGVTMTGYPALVDEGQTVGVRVLDTPERARHAMHQGLRRLFYLQVEPEVRYRVKHLPGLEKMRLQMSTLADAQTWEQQLAELITDRAFLGDQPKLRDKEAFEAQLNAGWNRLGKVAEEVGKHVQQILANYQQVRLMLEQATNPQWKHAVVSIREQLDELLGAGFLTQTPWDWLIRYPRYLAGSATRLKKLSNAGLERDRQLHAEFERWWRAFVKQREDHEQRGVFDPALFELRWMLEEYRVSLFAQELGTAVTVSPKRLEKQWGKLRRG